MADGNKNAENSEASGYPIKCPFCGSANPIGSAFCQECGKKFSDEPPTQPTANNISYHPPPSPTTNYQPPYIGRSHRSRNIIIAVVAGILIVSLVFAAVLFISPNNNSNNSQPTPTPQATTEPTAAPTAIPTLTPTLAPTLQPQNNTITTVNLQFVYQSSDQSYFGPTSQTLSFSNQPNGMLSINQGEQFWYSFKLTAGTSAQPDSISSISVSTPGFSIVSVDPTTPIAFTAGSSITITVNFQSPQSSFDGAVSLVLTTSG